MPDIAIVDHEFASTDPTRYPSNTMLSVVEIVSPGSEPQDRVIKPQLYAEAGITVYWRFELTPKPHTVVSELRRGRYVQTDTVMAGRRSLISCTFPVEIDLSG